MKKLLVFQFLLVYLLVACNQEELSDTASYNNKTVTEITVYENWQSILFSRFNKTEFLTSLKSKVIFTDKESMESILEAIIVTEVTDSFELVLINSDFDLVLTFDDGTTKKYYLSLNGEGEEGLLMGAPPESEAYRIPVEETNLLRDVITKE